MTYTEMKLSNSTESKSAYLYRLLSVQDYLLKEMETEESIFKLQDYQQAIYRLDECIDFMTKGHSPGTLAN